MSPMIAAASSRPADRHQRTGPHALQRRHRFGHGRGWRRPLWPHRYRDGEHRHHLGGAFGINAGVANIVSSGTITGKVAIRAFDNSQGSTIVNAGAIVSTDGAKGTAIKLTEAADTLTLRSGSRIVGQVDMGGGNDTVNVVGVIPVTKLSTLTTLAMPTNLINFTGTPWKALRIPTRAAAAPPRAEGGLRSREACRPHGEEHRVAMRLEPWPQTPSKRPRASRRAACSRAPQHEGSTNTAFANASPRMCADAVSLSPPSRRAEPDATINIT
jgi:hypothetical protein